MSIKMILFDLDGTLLPMDQNVFIKTYFGALVKKLLPHGYDAKQLVDVIWQGTAAMVANDGDRFNEEVFFDVFRGVYGDRAQTDKHFFDEFYQNDFDREVRVSCGYNEKARLTLDKIKAKGYRVALATNPLFPSLATEYRIAWAGFSPDYFELFTTYENSRHCKPSLDYYREVIEKLGVDAEECLMVGNDVSEDMIASKLGMKVFLLTDCLINKSDEDISHYPSGSFDELLEYINEL